MGSTAYAGLLVSGGGGWSLATGTFDDVRVTSTTAPGPIISGISATTGSAGESVTVWGSGFGASQLNSSVLVNGAAATVSSWSATSISFTIPTGATTGPVIVVVSPDLLDSNPVKFTITTNPLPSGWDDQDLGSTGGSATYSSGQYTVQGIGGLIQSSGGYTTSDSEHFVYQSLTGDGTIVARVVSLTGTNQIAGVMMRDTLDSGAMFASSAYTNGSSAQVALWYRSLTNTNDNEIVCNCNGSLWTPYWVKLTRSGTAFSTFKSPGGVNWQMTAPPQSINMGSTIYVGIFSTQGTAVFDNVSIAASGSSSPTITSLTSSTGSVGSQIIISGSGFGSTQGNSAVMLNDTPMTVNLWSDTAITFTVVSGATSGPLVVSVAPSMNNSNAIPFTVTTHPLVSGWYDFPVGGAPGDASYSGGVFTVHSNGTGISGGSDQFHFVYQPLSTDGTIIVRVASLSGASTALQAGVAIRQTLDTSSAESAAFFVNGTPTLTTRTILSGVGSQQTASAISLPYWLKLVRSQNSFAAYSSPDGIGWAQIGTTQTMVSARNVNIGFGVGGGGSAQITATFDNVSVTAGGSLSNPIATAISPSSGPAGTAVTVTGTGFGSTTGTIFFNGVPGTVTSWSDTSIQAVVPENATSGPVYVTTGNITTSYGGGGSAEIVFNVVLTAVVTDSLGNQSTYHSSLFGGMFQFTDSTGSGCSTCNVRGTIHNEYDSKGNRLWVTDELGHTKYDQFDSSYNLIVKTVFPTAATPATTTYAYNSLGQVTTVTDALGNKVSNTYDSHGNLTAVSNWSPNGGTLSTINIGYDSKGQLTTITDPLNHVTTITFNSVGLISSITDAQSNVTSYAYDSRGNRTSVTDALSHTTTFTYDNGDRLTQITYPDSTTKSFGYDYRGRRTSVTDQNGKTTNYTYDDADRLLTVTDAASNVTTYSYDTENNLTSITDANSHETSFTYDAFGRVTQTNFPSSHVESFSYDAVGNLTSKTDRNGNTINYVYDGLNRLTRKVYPDSTEADYVYDLVGRIQQVNDPTGTYQFSYDGMGRLTGTTTNYSFLTSRSFTTSYTYDAASNRTGFTDPEGGSTMYAYDTLNRLQTLTPPSAFTSGNFGLSYDALSRRTQMTRPNGVTTNYAYDNLSRLTSILHQLSGSTVDGAAYTVDNVGNRTAKTDKQTNVTYNYTYDNIYQLTQVVLGTTTTESYSYDPVGNRTASLGVSSYTTNSSNELTGTTGASFTYDYNGNNTSKTVSGNTTNYSWDFENRLTSVTLPGGGGIVSFKYDPFGRRVYKSSGSGTIVFAYDGDNLIEETNASGAALARYSQGLNIDEPLAMLRSSTTSYYNLDGLGTVTSLANSSGALAQTYAFDSFGNQIVSSGSNTNPFQYTARESDNEIGLYYYRARYYDPGPSRFLNEDPARFAGGKNLYRYVQNNPVRRKDPRGLWQVDIGGGLVLGAEVSFGSNNGQWNFQLYTGVGEGLFGSYDPRETEGCHKLGGYGASKAEGGFGIGKYGSFDADFSNDDTDPNGEINFEVNIGNYGLNWNPAEPHKPPHGVVSAGEGGFDGIGFVVFSPPQCGCEKE
jgi:RHS repeat-associated protein